MIEIVMTGQSGKSDLLFQMHRLRARVLREQLKWDVSVQRGLEVDQYDLPDTLYLLSLNQRKEVRGCWRLLPSTGTTMLGDVFGHLLPAHQPMPRDPAAWEASRFVVERHGEGRVSLAESSAALREMIAALCDFSALMQLREIWTACEVSMLRLASRLGYQPDWVGPAQKVGNYECVAARFLMPPEQSKDLRRHLGFAHPVLHPDDLPAQAWALRKKGSSDAVPRCA
ncbi:MAG: conjugal transfer protein TraI [Alphaproteobacteria bacterium]|nr:MAG: conjugal transfer protein TraI [Alphaproteobacteria bacterium]